MGKNKTLWLAIPGIVLLGLSAIASRTEPHVAMPAQTVANGHIVSSLSALVIRAQSCGPAGRSGSCQLISGAETDWNGLYEPAGIMNGSPAYRRDSTHYLASNGKGNWGLVKSPDAINSHIANWDYCVRGGKAAPPNRKWVRMAGLV